MFLIKCNIKIYLQSQYAWGPNPILPLFGHVNLSQLFNFSVLISSSVKWKEYLMTGWVGNQNPAPFLNNETRCNLHSGAPSEWPKSHAHLKPHPCVAPSLSWFCFPLSLTSFPSKNYIYIHQHSFYPVHHVQLSTKRYSIPKDKKTVWRDSKH